MFTVSDLSIINVFIIINASLSYHTIHMAISNSCTHSCFIWQIFQNIITWVLEKACFPFFKRTSRHQVEKKWLVILFDTVISRQHSERELVKAIELFLGWFEELLLTKHPTFCIRCGHKIGEPSLYFKSITLHLHGVNEWIPLESFDYWKVHWGLLQQNSDSWRHTLVCIDEYKKNCTGIISQDFSVN